MAIILDLTSMVVLPPGYKPIRSEDLQLLLLGTLQWCWPKWCVPGAGSPGLAAELS
jgi:hypothetical protein